MVTPLCFIWLSLPGLPGLPGQPGLLGPLGQLSPLENRSILFNLPSAA